MSSKMEIKATSPVVCEPANVQNAVFIASNNRFFAHVNNKFLGTFDSRDEAASAVRQFSTDRCLHLKRAVLQY